MRLPPRRVLTPSGTTNKRKERDDPFERPKPKTIPAPPSMKLLKPNPWAGSEPITGTSKGALTEPKPKPSNQLLAGYLAHEFLTKGTLLGQPWAPPRTDGPTKGKSSTEDGGEEGQPTTATATAAAAAATTRTEEERERYAEVAGLLKGGGTQLPGVVNPTQLARFLHL
ncbi:hypothetical protein VNO78_21928 [Psophocarpus tetragonolobus]|uniref:Uncharacterized protein n=1 Tax=Psophocarpus tetragonolobus TaxID=3891 RepID=A0AAN9SCS4_PSOTE